MSQDPYSGEQPYADEPASASTKAGGGSKVNVPTILASAGVAAVVSALVVTIGVVGLVTSDRFGSNNAEPQPTVVNLGNATTPGAPAAPAVPPTGAAAPTTVEGAPTEEVPESPGDAGAGSGDAAPTTTAQAQPTQQAAPSTTKAAPAPLTAGQLNTKIKTIMNTGASDAARADEMEGGRRALGSVGAVAQMLRVSGAGFTYKVVGPVTQNGETLNARLQMSLVGNGSRYLDLSWVWMDGKWKLSNTAVCAVAAYAMLPCTVG